MAGNDILWKRRKLERMAAGNGDVRFDTLRAEALNARDAGLYAILVDLDCLSEGDIEDNDLYERGSGVLRELESEESSFDRQMQDAASRKNYGDFLREARGLGVRTDDLGAEATTKGKLLQKYFPERFGENGGQNIGGYSPEQKGRVFKRIINYAKGLNERE